jgi:hypothetical protein
MNRNEFGKPELTSVAFGSIPNPPVNLLRVMVQSAREQAQRLYADNPTLLAGILADLAVTEEKLTSGGDSQ